MIVIFVACSVICRVNVVVVAACPVLVHFVLPIFALNRVITVIDYPIRSVRRQALIFIRVHRQVRTFLPQLPLALCNHYALRQRACYYCVSRCAAAFLHIMAFLETRTCSWRLQWALLYTLIGT